MGAGAGGIAHLKVKGPLNRPLPTKEFLGGEEAGLLSNLKPVVPFGFPAFGLYPGDFSLRRPYLAPLPQLAQALRVTLCFHVHTAVRLVADEAGQAQLLGLLLSGLAEKKRPGRCRKRGG